MKKLTAFLLALCLMIPLLPAHAKEGVSIIPSTASWWGLAPEEPDPPAWAAPAYEALKARDIADLHTSGNITRGRFVILLVILLRRAFQSKELKGYPRRRRATSSTRATTALFSGMPRAMGS